MRIHGSGRTAARQHREILDDRPGIGDPAPVADALGVVVGRQARGQFVVQHRGAQRGRRSVLPQVVQCGREGVTGIADVVDQQHPPVVDLQRQRVAHDRVRRPVRSTVVLDLETDERHDAEVVGQQPRHGIAAARDGDDQVRCVTRVRDAPVQRAAKPFEASPADEFVRHLSHPFGRTTRRRPL